MDRIDRLTVRLLIATGIYPPDHGGPARFVPALAEAALKRGWSVGVITLGDVAAATSSRSNGSYRVLTVPRQLSRPKRVGSVVRRLVKGLGGGDVLFANGLYEESFLATRLVRRPWVAKIVGDPIWERARNSGATSSSIEAFQSETPTNALGLQRFMLTRALNSAASIVTPSAQLAVIIEGWGLTSPLVIPNGVPVSAIGNSTPTFDVVTVCRLVPWKGVDVLIRACVAEGLSLLIVGDGPQRPSLELLTKDLGGASLVTFAGAVDAAATRPLIDSARIFALNSSYEGMSFALLEARERALPVVVGRNAGNEAVVRSGIDGLVVDPRSESELRLAFASLLSDPAMARRLGKAGRQDIVDHYSLETTTAATLAVLEEIASD